MKGARGAAAMARGRLKQLEGQGLLKDVLVTFQLLYSPHTEGLTAANAIAIVNKARAHKLDPFDLWMIFDGYVCDDLDQAVVKAIEMKTLYDPSTPLTPMDSN
jgi:hypothetical protein